MQKISRKAISLEDMRAGECALPGALASDSFWPALGLPCPTPVAWGFHGQPSDQTSIWVPIAGFPGALRALGVTAFLTLSGHP